MNAQADHSNPTALSRLSAWVNARWQARRARRLQEDTVVCLSALDSKLVNDIGVGIDRLDELTPRRDDAAARSPMRNSWRETRT